MKDVSFTVKPTHTREMLNEELLLMMGGMQEKQTLTLQKYVELYLLNSPYVRGGDVTMEDAAKAQKLFACTDCEVRQFDADLRRQLDAVSRALQIFPPPRKKPRGTSYEAFSPEWLADTVASVGQSLPGMTYREILNLPMVAVVHMTASSFRRNGGDTRRPSNDLEALKLLEAQKKK